MKYMSVLVDAIDHVATLKSGSSSIFKHFYTNTYYFMTLELLSFIDHI